MRYQLRAIRFIFATFAIAIVVTSASAQQSRVLAPHDPVPPKMAKPQALPSPKAGTVVAGPWMVDANFKSTIYVKNLVETSAVTVTPILYLSNGAKYTLLDLKLDPAGTSVIDVNAALQDLGIAPSATLSGYVEIGYNWPWDPICATIRDLDTAHSLIFYYGSRPSKPAQLPNQPAPIPGPKANIVEGTWWKQEPNVTGFVTLTNTGVQPVNAQLDVSDNQGAILAGHAITISPHGTKLIDLNELDSVSTSLGGIRVTYTADADPVLINGGLQDQSVGYSDVIPFAPAPQPSNSSSSTIAELGLMTGPADPMLRFPAETVFTPYSVLRNISNAPLTATPTLWWMAGGTAQSVQLGQIVLAPYESRLLDVPAMLATAGLKKLSGSVNLVFAVLGNAGGLLVAGGAVDQSNTYVFGVVPKGVSWSAGKSLSYWSIGNEDDTMVTLWNPADEAQDFIFRLDFPGGHYRFPIHLSPKATQMFNISEIVNSQTPDDEGKVIPLGVQEGSAELMGTQDEVEHILVAMDSAIYNVKKATCGSYTCETCIGVTSSEVTDDPWATGVNGTHQLTFTETYNTGEQYGVTSQSQWHSNATTVATVNTGLVSGVSAGSATMSAIDNVSEPGYYNGCGYYLPACPIYTFNPGGGASGDVGNVTCSPSPVTRGSSVTCTATGSSGSTFSNWKFTDGTNTVNGSGTSSTWSGISVTSGTVSVTVTGSDGSISTPSASVTVNPRSNWALSPKQSARKSSGYTCENGVLLSVPTTPTVPAQNLGQSCPDPHFQTQNEAASGPNAGYDYITSVTDIGEYSWVISGDVDNPSSQFYQAQCGNYNASTNPNGYISGSTLDSDDQRHEGGSVNSHYAEYSAAYQNSANNPGIVMESFVEFNPSNFGNDVSNKLGQLATTILAAANPEPCNNGYAGYSAACVFDGYVNYTPYVSCH